MMWNSTATDVLEISQQTQDNINFCTSIEAKINETSVVLYHFKKKKLILVLIIKLFYWKCKCSWSLQAQSFGAIKQKIYIYSWLNFKVIHIVSFPRALGWRVNYCSGLSNNLVPRVHKNSTSSVERERGWLSIPKLINNSRKKNRNKEIISVTEVGKN